MNAPKIKIAPVHADMSQFNCHNDELHVGGIKTQQHRKTGG